MDDVLDDPTDARLLQEGVEEYRAEISARRYLEVMGLDPPK
jgi:hypothetical protein